MIAEDSTPCPEKTEVNTAVSPEFREFRKVVEGMFFGMFQDKQASRFQQSGRQDF